MDDRSFYIYGRNAIVEALESGKELEKVYIEFGSQGAVVNKIITMLRKERIPFVQFDKKKFDDLRRRACPPDARHQGVIALIAQFKSLTLKELLGKSLAEAKNPVIIALDEINDPQNLGAIARSAECSGAAGLIIPEHGGSPVTPAAIKASAGALEHIPVAKVNNLGLALETAKNSGFWVAGAAAEGDRLYYEELFDRAIIIVVGNEGKGLRQSIRKRCDFMVRIPLKGKINSLNSSVAAGIIMFEIMKQREEQL